ncbi:MAG: ABC transporter permease [Clostridium sp.]
MDKKRAFVYSLNIIQLVAFFVLFITLIGNATTFKELYDNHVNLFPEGKVLKYQSTFQSDDYIKEKKHYSDIEKILNGFKENGDITSIINVNYQDNKFREISDVKSVKINMDFMKRYPLKIKSGRNFKESELSGEEKVIPIIIGSDLEGRLSIGDELTDIINNKSQRVEGDKLITEIPSYNYKRIENYYKYKVIGIAEPNTMVYLDENINDVSSGYRNNLIYVGNYKLDAKIYQNNVFDEELSNEYGNDQGIGIVECKSKDVTNNIKDVLNRELSARDNLGILASSVQNNDMLQDLRRGFITSLIFALVFIAFSLLGVIGTMIYSINDRRKEFGILMSQGATKNHLIVKNILDIGIILIIAVVISLGVTVLLRNNVDKELVTFGEEYFKEISYNNTKYLYVINGVLIKYVGGISLLIVFISSLPIIYKIKKFTVVELIRGK